MSLELQCPQCFSRLNVPDEAAGASAKCPHCEKVFDVDSNVSDFDSAAAVESAPSVGETQPPNPATPSGGSSGSIDETLPHDSGTSGFGDAEDSANPYAAPANASATVYQGLPKVPLDFGRLDAGVAFRLAWGAFKENAATLILAHAVVMLIGISLALLGEGARRIGLGSVGMIIDVPIAYGVQWFLLIGLTTITLAVARGRRPIEINELFAGGPQFPSLVAYMIVYVLMVVVGLLFLIVPGVYLALRYWPGAHLIVDRGVTMREAFELASAHTEGNLTQSALLALYGFAVFVVGFLMCYIGLFVTLPLYSMLWSTAFLMITRQPIQQTGE